jgi:hypothetical protein
MSVVGRDWEAMKRYNIHELYAAASKPVEEEEKESKLEGEEEGKAEPTA